MFIDIESATVTSQCPLLEPEPADEFLPAVCMPVPRQSAWISLSIDLCDHADVDGIVDYATLASALRQAVDEGDRRHDQTQWSEPMIEYDSWLNRRLAIVIRGWGDLVERRTADPASFATLRELETLAQWVCATLHERSRRLADGSNRCPALDEAGARVLNKSASRGWQQRWHSAIASVAVRHRNLTTMSPWDVFPRQKPAQTAYLDLLPLLRFADALSFQRDVPFSHWNTLDFNNFRDRVAAIMRCNSGAGLVAKQV